jgi:hypothetical protein
MESCGRPFPLITPARKSRKRVRSGATRQRSKAWRAGGVSPRIRDGEQNPGGYTDRGLI